MKNNKTFSQLNKGFSLIEVILSMTIIALISVPLMSFFTQSLGYSALTAKSQESTLLAQEVMENCKSLDTLVEVSYDDITGDTQFSAAYLEEKGYVLVSGTTNVESLTENDSLVYYGLADAIGEDYDVVVTLTGTESNQVSMAQIYDVDSSTDVFAAEGSQYNDALTFYQQAYQTYCTKNELEADSAVIARIADEMQRTITIDISAVTGGYQVQISCDYTLDAAYTITDSAGNVTIDSTGIPGIYINYQKGTQNTTYNAQDFTSVSMTSLEKIYLIYIPCFNDVLVVNSSVTVDVTPELILAAQYTEDTEDDGDDEVDKVPDKYLLTVKNELSAISQIRTNLDNSQISCSVGVVGLNDSEQGLRRVAIEIAVYPSGTIDATNGIYTLDESVSSYINLTSSESY